MKPLCLPFLLCGVLAACGPSGGTAASTASGGATAGASSSGGRGGTTGGPGSTSTTSGSSSGGTVGSHATSTASSSAGGASGSGTTAGAGTSGGGSTGGTSASGGSSGGSTAGLCGFGPTRDPIAQPFASGSIWNTPIGSGAVYVPAAIVPPSQWAIGHDEDVLVLTPTAPLTEVDYSSAGWGNVNDRCTPDSPLQALFTLPLPADFVLDYTSGTPNACLAGLAQDGHTLIQGQPFARCSDGGPETIEYLSSGDPFGPDDAGVPDEDLYGDGLFGSHGGSSLSALGGSLRVGELRPGGCAPRHALKVDLDGAENYYNDGAGCFVWPATSSDSGGCGPGGYYGGSNPALLEGALLALPASLDITAMGFETEPGLQLAWTFQNYGAYVVDDTGDSAFDICTELGPAGSFGDQFEADYGYDMEQAQVNPTGPEPWAQWVRDVDRIFLNLAVVANNGPTTVGGGGTPLQPLAPQIGEGADGG
ncbi:MAG TPA: hypothetical protein VMB50_03405 [Myxococcales bacterium]|nr:hypothetical protein [Myxococcales bacterium]